MANLISSKQISGVVTASAVSGDFQVSGSSNFTGSLNVTGSISASGNISGSSFFGDGSTLSGIELSGRGVFSGSEQLPGGLISSSEQLPGGIVSGAAQLLSTFDTRYLNTDGDGVVSGSFLSVGGLGVVSGSSQVSFTGLDNLPAGLISGSIQVLGSTGILSSSEQLPAGIISSSAQLHSDLDSRYATDLGEGIVSGSVLRPGGDDVISGSEQVDFDSLANLPAGLVSGSVQVLAGTGILSSSEQLPVGLISSSEQLPANVVSGSEQIVDVLGSVNTYTASNDTRLLDIESTTASLDNRVTILQTGTVAQDNRLDSLEEATSSYESIGSGIVSGSIQILGGSDIVSSSAQITSLGFVSSSGDTIPAGTISGSAQITELGFVSSSGGENTSLNSYTASTDDRLDNIESSTSSLEQRVEQIESNTSSYEEKTIITSLNSYTSSTDTRLDGFNTYTSSTDQRLERIEFTSSSLETRVNDLANATASINSFTGSVFISSSAQITALGFVSSSSEASVSHLNNFTSSATIQLSNLESFSSSNENTSLNEFTESIEGINAYTASTTIRLNNLEVTTSSFENKFGSIESTTSSFQNRFETIESTTSSFQSRFGTIETETASIDARLDNIEGATSSYETIGRSIVSGSSQLTSSYDERYEARASATNTLLSASIQVNYEELANLPDNIVSSSEQLPGGLVSGSIQVLGGTDIISGSEQLQDLGFRSGSLITGEVSDIELEMSGSGSFKRKALTDSYQNLEFISTPLFQTGSSNWTISDGSFVRITTSGTYLLNSNFTLFKANDNDRVALFKWQRSLNNTDWTDVSGSTFGIGSPSQEPDYAYGGGVSTTFFESGSYVRIVGKIDASSEEPIALHNSDSEGGRSTVSMFLINGTNAGGGGGGSTDLGSLSPSVIDVANDSIGFIDASNSDGSRRESVVDLVNAIAGTNITANNGQLSTIGPAGTISGSAQITALGFSSGSIGQVESASFDDRLDQVQTVTESFAQRIGSLEGESGSYLTQAPAGTVSGSDQLSSSFELRGSGIVSGAQQVTDLGFAVTSSNTFNGTQTFSGSILPATPSTYDLGSLDKPFRDLFITSESIKFVKDGAVLSEIKADSEQIKIGNIRITTSSIELINNAGNVVQNVVEGTFTGGDVTAGNVKAPSGTISGSEQITGLGFISSSDSTTSLNTFTSSIQTEVDGLSAATSSYLTSLDSNIVSSSEQITALGFVSESGGENTSLNAFTSSANVQLSNLESFTGSVLISSSAQITALGFVSESGGENTSLNTFTSSIQTEVDGLSAATSSYLTSSGSVDFTDITSIPSGIVSSSEQLPGGIISGSEQLPGGLVSGSAQSVAHITGADLDMGGNKVLFGNVYSNEGDLPNASTYHGMFAHVHATGRGYFAHAGAWHPLVNLSDGVLSGSIESQLPSGTISSSAQITSLGFVSESGDSTPAGTISGSEQITSLGFISSSDSTTSLNSYTASTDVRINQLASETGSYLTSLDSGIVSGAGQIGALGYISGSQVSSSIAFDGNRTVSNTDLPSGVYNNNFGTSGSIQNFLESVFFPNTSPVINSVSFSIDEFEDIDSIIGTVSATDAEGQTITFATQSGYTDDKFGIHPSTGVITARARTTSSLNTDTSVFAGGAHPFLIKATDTFSGTTNKTIHIRVTPNTAPKFREGSVGGTQITSVTASFNENSSNNALVKRVYFTDDESDSITITSTSIDNEHFDITVYSNYFDIRQNTGSLDYEVQSLYTFAVTASDEHFLSASQGTVGQSILPISVSVTDNVHPTINNQTLSSISENSSNGAVVATISATDNEGDTITFSDFTLYKLELDDANVSSASYGGTSHTDPTNNAFQCSGTGQVTRKNGVYINSDLINEYQYTVRIRDSYNTASNEAIITIPISDDTPPTVSDNWSTPYVIESAVSGASVYVNSNGRSGTIAAFSANQSVTWTMNSGSGVFDINSSNGRLSIKTDLSGSTTSSGALLSGSTIATNTFGTTTETAFTASVAANQAPSIAFTNQTAKFETNLALDGVCMVSMSVSDDESDTPFSASLSGSDLELVYSNANSSSIGLHLTENATAREYFYSVTITDQFGKSQTYSDRSFTVATSADYGRVFVYDVGYNIAAYNTAVAISSQDSSTPPVATPYTGDSIGFLDKIVNDNTIGSSTFDYSYGGSQTATKLGEASGSNLHSVLRSMGSSGVISRSNSNHFVILFPSGSDMGGIPTSTIDSYGGSTVGQYVLEVGTDGTTIDGTNTIEASQINQITLATAHVGYTKWFMVGATNQIASSTNFNLGLNPSSGSGGE